MYDCTNETNNAELYSDCLGSDNIMRIRKLLLAERSEKITEEMLLGACLEIMETEFRSLWKVHFYVMVDSVNILIDRYRDQFPDNYRFDMDSYDHDHDYIGECLVMCSESPAEEAHTDLKKFADIARMVVRHYKDVQDL